METPCLYSTPVGCSLCFVFTQIQFSFFVLFTSWLRPVFAYHGGGTSNFWETKCMRARSRRKRGPFVWSQIFDLYGVVDTQNQSEKKKKMQFNALSMVFIDFDCLCFCSWRLDLHFPWTTNEKRVLFFLGEQTLESCRLQWDPRGRRFIVSPEQRLSLVRWGYFCSNHAPWSMVHSPWSIVHGAPMVVVVVVMVHTPSRSFLPSLACLLVVLISIAYCTSYSLHYSFIFLFCNQLNSGFYLTHPSLYQAHHHTV